MVGWNSCVGAGALEIGIRFEGAHFGDGKRWELGSFLVRIWGTRPRACARQGGPAAWVMCLRFLLLQNTSQTQSQDNLSKSKATKCSYNKYTTAHWGNILSRKPLSPYDFSNTPTINANHTRQSKFSKSAQKAFQFPLDFYD